MRAQNSVAFFDLVKHSPISAGASIDLHSSQVLFAIPTPTLAELYGKRRKISAINPECPKLQLMCVHDSRAVLESFPTIPMPVSILLIMALQGRVTANVDVALIP
jgi:hypothetical protein